MAPKRSQARDSTPSKGQQATNASSTTPSSHSSASAPITATTPNTTTGAVLGTPSTSTSKTSSSAKNSAAAAATSNQQQHSKSPQDVALGVWKNYLDTTPQRMKLIDAFMAFLVVVGALQFVYCVLVGNYPFNAFLSGFSATVGQFVLTASLRIQTNPLNKADFYQMSPERAFADYVFGSLILHFFCINFIN